MEQQKFDSKSVKINTLRPIISEGRKGRRLFIETYGCQMNTGDSEVVVSLLQKEGYVYTDDIKAADVILINTCSIRDNAEVRIWGRLREMRPLRRANKGLIIGILGCMAERLKESLLEGVDGVDVVAGPDSYRALPELLRDAELGVRGANTQLSVDETYAELSPVRLDKSGVSAYVAIMRGCNNYCSYCVVPYTRGRERSRDAATILREVRELFDNGYKEVTLLGQNVNSYSSEGYDFPRLMAAVADISPLLRVRFSTSHPKDMSDDLLKVIGEKPNICRAIHLPAQSGSTSMLKRMNRGYSREWYLDRIAAIKRYIPGCAISTDIIAGFSGETDEEHNDTLSLMREVGYEFAFMYKYSEREGTFAHKNLADDVDDKLKVERLTEIITLQRELATISNKRDVGGLFEVLVEGESKKSAEQMHGRTSHNKVVVFDRCDAKVGDYVMVKILRSSSATLIGELVK